MAVKACLVLPLSDRQSGAGFSFSFFPHRRWQSTFGRGRKAGREPTSRGQQLRKPPARRAATGNAHVLHRGFCPLPAGRRPAAGDDFIRGRRARTLSVRPGFALAEDAVGSWRTRVSALPVFLVWLHPCGGGASAFPGRDLSRPRESSPSS